MDSYDAMKKMVEYAIWASLAAMRREGLERAIIAPLSCGIYGGEHKDQLRSEYADLCMDVLAEVEAAHGPFKQVLVPVFTEKDGSTGKSGGKGKGGGRGKRDSKAKGGHGGKAKGGSKARDQSKGKGGGKGKGRTRDNSTRGIGRGSKGKGHK